MSLPKPKDEQGVLLFEEDDGEATTSDPQLEQKISQYLKERVSVKEQGPETKPAAGKEGPDGEEHTGLTDDDDEGEPDYDVASRMTLKASSEAFMEVMAEARLQYEKEKEAARKKKAGAAAAAAKEGAKKA